MTGFIERFELIMDSVNTIGASSDGVNYTLSSTVNSLMFTVSRAYVQEYVDHNARFEKYAPSEEQLTVHKRKLADVAKLAHYALSFAPRGFKFDPVQVAQNHVDYRIRTTRESFVMKLNPMDLGSLPPEVREDYEDVLQDILSDFEGDDDAPTLRDVVVMQQQDAQSVIDAYEQHGSAAVRAFARDVGQDDLPTWPRDPDYVTPEEMQDAFGRSADIEISNRELLQLLYALSGNLARQRQSQGKVLLRAHTGRPISERARLAIRGTRKMITALQEQVEALILDLQQAQEQDSSAPLPVGDTAIH